MVQLCKPTSDHILIWRSGRGGKCAFLPKSKIQQFPTSLVQFKKWLHTDICLYNYGNLFQLLAEVGNPRSPHSWKWNGIWLCKLIRALVQCSVSYLCRVCNLFLPALKMPQASDVHRIPQNAWGQDNCDLYQNYINKWFAYLFGSDIISLKQARL